jgi:hypothetical protein
MPCRAPATAVGRPLAGPCGRKAQAAAWVGLAAALLALGPLRPATAADGTPRPAAVSADAGWASLTAAQKTALAPLQRDWASIGPSVRQKWLEVAARFPSMSAAERQRVQERMTEWTRLSPAERAQARLQFQEARQISPQDRQAKWEAYQALPQEQRRELADRSRPALDNPAAIAGSVPGPAAPDSKRNIVEPQRRPTAKPVTPTIVQARPGASTTLMSSPPAPPMHNQAGLPKIAATEGFVNPSTLLPRVGPQGAAVQAASASQPGTRR